jgi:crotonobetainyl-CoA:carnitine CoA-transferase CaiB-like acyl-CoA transferase
LPLKGTRILSLALNLPGPAALMRLRALGAICTKVEPPSGDPMQVYRASFYAQLHEGVKVLRHDLKKPADLEALHRLLAKTDVLLTSFRPQALEKLGLGWMALHRRHPQLSQVAIVGYPGERANEPGHDLTYIAENGLIDGPHLPPTLWADMGGAQLAVEAVLGCVVADLRAKAGGKPARGRFVEVPLSAAAEYAALPRQHGMTVPGELLGGGFSAYGVYPCQGGLVAIAALEPHFQAALWAAVGGTAGAKPQSHAQVKRWCAAQTPAQLNAVAKAHDLPLLAWVAS